MTPAAAVVDWLQSIAALLAGVVAGEGCFTYSELPARRVDGSTRLRFVFCVSMATRDRSILEALATLFQTGSIADRPPPTPGQQAMSTYAVGGRRALREVVIPFADRYLPPSAKRRQFDAWRATFKAYEHRHPSRWGVGPSPCTVEGCERPVRGRGLCRAHYYRATGH